MSAKKNPGWVPGVSEDAVCYDAVSAANDTDRSIGNKSVDDVHLAELAGSAIPAAVAEAAGVYTAHTADQLPESVRWIAQGRVSALPALVYPMSEVDGSATCQVKPQPGSVTSKDGRALKYVGPSGRGNGPQLPALRTVDGSGTILIVEGCKQALAALAWAPDDIDIYRIAGVWSWRVGSNVEGEPGSPTPHLPVVVAGKKVVIFGDADAATSIMVHDGLAALREAALSAGAASVKFGRTGGTAKQGLDDVLAALPEAARRDALVRWIGAAVATPGGLGKADANRLRKAAAAERARNENAKRIEDTREAGREDLKLGGDWHVDGVQVAGQTADKLGGRVLFARGGSIFELAGDGEARLREAKTDEVHRLALSAVRPLTVVTVDGRTEPRVVPGFKRDFVGILRGHLLPLLPEIKRISRGPVVRPDGTVVTTSGYDSATQVLLALDPAIEGLAVPEHPSDADIGAATELLRDDLFEMDGVGGFDGWVFKREADRTHAIAFLITAIMRSAFGVAPLFLLDGQAPGVGKGEVIHTVHRVVFGSDAPIAAMPAKDEEVEKRVTASLRAGASMIALDEVMGADATSRLDTPALRAALTTSKWSGRVLGASEMVEIEQEAVWAATGNNIETPTDMIRRVLQIVLYSDRPDLEQRSNFRRNLPAWIAENRPALLTAVLTLIRAWYDRGQPDGDVPTGVVTFNEWSRVVGGILTLAGLEGFLTTLQELRESANSELSDNFEHLEWVEGAVADLPTAPRFTAQEVVRKAIADPDRAAPYGHVLDDMDARALGMAWRRLDGRWFNGIRILSDGLGHRKVRLWRIERAGDPSAAVSTDAAPAADAATVRPASGAAPGETFTYSDRRGVRHTAARAMPSMTGLTISELGGA